MKYKKIILGLLVTCATVTSLNAGDTWTTGEYANNVNITETLTIPNAEVLIVTVSGETERNYDFITIKDSNGTTVRRLSGDMNETFEVSGGAISANLTSDYSITKSGVTVSVREGESPEKEESLIIHPRAGTVLGREPVYFQLAEGVQLEEGVQDLYWQEVIDESTDLYGGRMPIKDQYLRFINTTQMNKIRVCVVDWNIPEEDCIIYDIQQYNPFNARFEGGTFRFTGAEFLHISHSTSRRGNTQLGGTGRYYEYFASKSVSGLTDWGYPHVMGDNYSGYYTIVLCGYENDAWICQTSSLPTFPM